MPDQTHIVLVGRDGKLGWVDPKEQPADENQAIVRLENGAAVRIPADLLELRSDGKYFIPFHRAQLSSIGQPAEGTDENVLVIPVIAEELAVSKQQVTKGRVKITKQVHEREEVVDVPILYQEVSVERKPVDSLVDTPPEVRFEGETMIIPVVEEVLVVEKRLRLKEEVWITRVQKETREPKKVTLKEESVDVERIKGGRINRKEV